MRLYNNQVFDEVFDCLLEVRSSSQWFSFSSSLHTVSLLWEIVLAFLLFEAVFVVGRLHYSNELLKSLPWLFPLLLQFVTLWETAVFIFLPFAIPSGFFHRLHCFLRRQICQHYPHFSTSIRHSKKLFCGDYESLSAPCIEIMPTFCACRTSSKLTPLVMMGIA